MKNMQIKEAKTKYESIQVSEDFKKRVNKTLKEDKKNSKYMYYIAGIFAAFVIFSSSLNLNESFARSVSNVAGFKDIINVLTMNKYNFEDENVSANVTIPKLQGLLDKELEDKINAQMQEDATNMITEFEDTVTTINQQNLEEHYAVQSDYIIKTNNEKVLSYEVYFLNIIGSSNTYKKFYNIDKINKNIITLESLFKSEEYVNRISEYIKSEMIHRNLNETESEYNMYWIGKEMDGFEAISKDQNFYIKNNGNIVIVFEKYEVGPGVLGCPEFEVPNEVVKDLLK